MTNNRDESDCGEANAVDQMDGAGRVRLATYDMDDVRAAIPEWDSLDRAEKLAALKELDPADVEETSNIQLEAFHEHLVDVFDPNQSVTPLTTSHLALGTDDSSVAYGDTGLNNEVYREGVDATTDNGNDLKVSTLLDEAEGNGSTYKELGLVSAASGGTFFNHALIEDTEKTDEITLTITVELQFRGTPEATDTQVKGFHEHLVDVIDPNQSVTAIDASHVALGTDGSSTTYTDTGLGDEVYREAIDSSKDLGTVLRLETLIGESDANGNTIREAGLVSEASGGTFIDHGLLEEIEKTNEVTFIIWNEPGFRAVR